MRMDNLKALRMERRMTQLELALEMDVAQPTIQMYESGNNEPNIEMLIKLADFFNVTIDYLVGRTTIRGHMEEEDKQFAYFLNRLQNTTAKNAAFTLLKEIR